MHWRIKGNSARVLFEPRAIPFNYKKTFLRLLQIKSKERYGVFIRHRYEHMLHSLQ